jgi:hypothetical protein
MKNYRSIWIKHNGPIPKDDKGRSYEIHHIDGNRKNNDISNLVCVSIEEHYKIHLDKKEYSSAALVHSRINNQLPLELVNKLRDDLIIRNKERKGVKAKTGECSFCGKICGLNMLNRHENSCKGNSNRKTQKYTEDRKKIENTQNYKKPKPWISERCKGKPNLGVSEYRKTIVGSKHISSIPVVMLDNYTGEELCEYESMSLAEKHTGIRSQQISRWCNGSVSRGKYTFKIKK